MNDSRRLFLRYGTLTLLSSSLTAVLGSTFSNISKESQSLSICVFFPKNKSYQDYLVDKSSWLLNNKADALISSYQADGLLEKVTKTTLDSSYINYDFIFKSTQFKYSFLKELEQDCVIDKKTREKMGYQIKITA